MPYENLSEEELREQIKKMEAKGFTVVNSSELRALNYELTRTRRMSVEDIIAEINRRKEMGLPISSDTAEHLRIMSERGNET